MLATPRRSRRRARPLLRWWRRPNVLTPLQLMRGELFFFPPAIVKTKTRRASLTTHDDDVNATHAHDVITHKMATDSFVSRVFWSSPRLLRAFSAKTRRQQKNKKNAAIVFCFFRCSFSPLRSFVFFFSFCFDRSPVCRQSTRVNRVGRTSAMERRSRDSVSFHDARAHIMNSLFSSSRKSPQVDRQLFARPYRLRTLALLRCSRRSPPRH